ncbi:hypothetical protein [Aureivirga sp. CE67]|uniref:hypothetical protein n=1 Tax=Aureivirga sp. CE67 TaxID=1788983 RepID=UPI0018C9F781|nr:hypothetical protein [Aureivirga sp. CE67]
MKLNYDLLKNVYTSKGYEFFDRGFYNLNLFGIRSNDLTVNEFNDFIGVAYKDELGNEQVFMFKGTTKPGLHYLKNEKLREHGTAILIPNQYKSAWKLDFHKGYEALRQNTTNFKVWRDGDSDGEFDYSGDVFTDVSGLNLHTTSFKNDIERVGKYSAGCQVVQDDKEFLILMSIIKKSLDFYGNSFTYTLLTEKDFN